METEELIRHLAVRADPVRRLAPPWKRAALWLAAGLPGVALVVILETPRDDLAAQLSNARFQIEQAAALATAVLAALAAFSLSAPGRDRRIALLPLAPLAVWLGSLGQGCLQGWLRTGSPTTFASDWMCLPGIAVAGSVPAIAILVMLRRGLALAPSLTVMLGALAAAALGNLGLRLFHPQDASLMVLVWQFGTVAGYSILAGCFGRFILRRPRASRSPVD